MERWGAGDDYVLQEDGEEGAAAGGGVLRLESGHSGGERQQ